MKKTIFIVFALITLSNFLTAQDNIISFRSQKLTGDTITLRILAYGPVEIDWGKGDKKTINSVSKNTRDKTVVSRILRYGHPEIKIKGDLFYLDCSNNKITAMNLTRTEKIRDLVCSENQITNLNLFNNSNLYTLKCANNPLKYVDLSKSPKLRTLDISHTRISSLYLTNNHGLKNLRCESTYLTELDLSQSPYLKDLYCAFNPLKILDLTHNPVVRNLDCRNTGIKTLDLSNNRNIDNIFINNSSFENMNYFDACTLNEIYKSLPIGAGRFIVIDNVFNEKKVIDYEGSNVKIGTNKGWKFYDYKDQIMELPVVDGKKCEN